MHFKQEMNKPDEVNRVHASFMEQVSFYSKTTLCILPKHEVPSVSELLASVVPLKVYLYCFLFLPHLIYNGPKSIANYNIIFSPRRAINLDYSHKSLRVYSTATHYPACIFSNHIIIVLSASF